VAGPFNWRELHAKALAEEIGLEVQSYKCQLRPDPTPTTGNENQIFNILFLCCPA
jgi:hypothetical protein